MRRYSGSHGFVEELGVPLALSCCRALDWLSVWETSILDGERAISHLPSVHFRYTGLVSRSTEILPADFNRWCRCAVGQDGGSNSESESTASSVFVFTCRRRPQCAACDIAYCSRLRQFGMRWDDRIWGLDWMGIEKYLQPPYQRSAFRCYCR